MNLMYVLRASVLPLPFSCNPKPYTKWFQEPGLWHQPAVISQPVHCRSADSCANTVICPRPEKPTTFLKEDQNFGFVFRLGFRVSGIRIVGSWLLKRSLFALRALPGSSGFVVAGQEGSRHAPGLQSQAGGLGFRV